MPQPSPSPGVAPRQHRRWAALSIGLLLPVLPLLACRAHLARQPPPPPAQAAELPAPAPPRLVPASGDGSGSTIALASFGDRRLALVADADGRALRVFDRTAGRELPPTPLGGTPAQVLVTQDGRVFVSLRDEAELDVLAPAPDLTFTVTHRVPTAVEPIALAVTPDERSLLVASGWGHALEVFAVGSLERRFRAEVAREPRAVVASADGRSAYVAHASASVVSVVDLASPAHGTEPIDLATGTSSSGRPFAWRHGYALVRSDLGILAPGIMADPGNTSERPSTYGGESLGPPEVFQVAALDGPAPSPSALHMAPSASCLLPRAAAYDALGDRLFVACQGSDLLLSIPVPSESPVTAWNVGAEPTGVAIDRETRTAFVWSQLSRRIAQVPMNGTPDAEVVTTQLGEAVDDSDRIRRGRALFSRTFDPEISSDGRACASCHPDGRDDGLVWSTPDGPRQTPTLAGRLAGTAPYGWNGARSSVAKHVAGTLKRLGGNGLDPGAMDALVAYCTTMKPPPDSERADADLVAEGRALFESSAAACASCHIQDGTFTDGNRHDVKSKAPGDPGGKFDTPSLRFVSGTAPYFHDGRFSTLRSLLRGSGGDGPGNVAMGHAGALGDGEIDALEAYLRTL